MLILNPQNVKYGTITLEKVALVAMERVAARALVEWGDVGPHVRFADVAEQRVNVRVVQEVDEVNVDAPRPGDSGTLSFIASMSATDSGRKKVSATAVVTGVQYEVRGGNTGRMPVPQARATRTITFVLVSSDGAADPVVVSEAGGGL